MPLIYLELNFLRPKNGSVDFVYQRAVGDEQRADPGQVDECAGDQPADGVGNSDDRNDETGAIYEHKEIDLLLVVKHKYSEK